MKEEIYIQQPDGRLVAGPSLPSSPKSKSKSKLKIILISLIWIVSLTFSFWSGFKTNDSSLAVSSLHQQVIQRLQDGCVFQFKGISTTDVGRLELEQQAKDAVRILKNQENAQNIKWSSVIAEDGVRKMDPTASRLVVVSWEVCR